MKACQYWCEYLKGKHFVILFFLIFRCHQSTLSRPIERECVLLVSMIRIFEDLPPFVDRFFLVNPLHTLAHATTCGAESGVKGKCKPLFTHCWSTKHFIVMNETYVYGDRDFFDEDSYQKKKLLDFVNLQGYLEGVVPSTEADKKCLKCMIYVS